MFRYFLIFIICFNFNVWAFSLDQNPKSVVSHQERASYLLDTGSNPSEPLQKLLSQLGISISGDLKHIVEQTQQRWLRSNTRWREPERFSDKKEIILPLLAELGCLDEVLPTRENYDYALLQGSTIGAMQSRLAFLCKLWESGVRFNELVILTGERDLDRDYEIHNLDSFGEKGLAVNATGGVNYGEIKTESDAMDYILKVSSLPNGLEKVKKTHVRVPKQFNGIQMRRPNTKDCYDMWLTEYQPSPGMILAISSQPYVGYQDSVAKTTLPVEYQIETVGFRAPENLSMSNHLDNLARWIYQESKRREQP